MTMFDFTSWLRQAFPRSQPTGKRAARRKTTQPPVLEQLEDRTVPSITWQVQSDYFGVNTGSESQPRSLRLALTADGQNIYGGFIQGTVSAAIRQVSSVVNSPHRQRRRLPNQFVWLKPPAHDGPGGQGHDLLSS